MGSNANAFAFKCNLNTFRKYLHLHLKKNSNTFKCILQIQHILEVDEFAGVFLSFCKAIKVILLLLLMLCIGKLN